MLALLKVLLSFFTLLSSLKAHEHPHQNMDNGLKPQDYAKLKPDPSRMVLPNNTFVPFHFGGSGSWALPRFQATLVTGTLKVIWADAFCAGDRVTVYMQSSDPGTFNLTNPGKAPSGPPSCRHYTPNPRIALQHPAFSSGSMIQNRPGTYNITIVSATSPYGAGQGFIKAIYNL